MLTFMFCSAENESTFAASVKFSFDAFWISMPLVALNNTRHHGRAEPALPSAAKRNSKLPGPSDVTVKPELLLLNFSVAHQSLTFSQIPNMSYLHENGRDYRLQILRGLGGGEARVCGHVAQGR